MEQAKNPESLESRITQFIDEGIETRRFSIKRAAGYHFELIGSTTPFVHVGYVRFLKAMGMSHPKMDGLSSFFIGRYWEFITQHHGTLAAQKGMAALRAFWIWSDMNGWIADRRIPADLSPHMNVAKPYRVKVTIAETK